MLRQVETFSDRFGINSLPDDLMASVEGLTELKSKNYGEVTLAAGSIIRESKVPGFEDRKTELRNLLLSEDKAALARSSALSAGVDLLSALFDDADEAISSAALEVYIRRVYRAHSILDITTSNIDGSLTANWKFQFADVPAEDSPIRHGQITVVKDFDGAAKLMPAMLAQMKVEVADNLTDDYSGNYTNPMTDRFPPGTNRSRQAPNPRQRALTQVVHRPSNMVAQEAAAT